MTSGFTTPLTEFPTTIEPLIPHTAVCNVGLVGAVLVKIIPLPPLLLALPPPAIGLLQKTLYNDETDFSFELGLRFGTTELL